MEKNKIITRNNIIVDELQRIIKKTIKGITVECEEFYYLDYDVNENTGVIDKEKKAIFYTKNQVDRNLKALKNAYFIAKGAVSPKEIVDFRSKYNIAASTLSVILGFSKNTISNIENYGITSLTSGRLIKIIINDKKTLIDYIEVCDSIESTKRKKLSKKILELG